MFVEPDSDQSMAGRNLFDTRDEFSTGSSEPTLAQGDMFMQSRIAASIVAGLVAGLVFGIMMHMITAPAPGGGRMPVIAMVGQIVGSPSVTIGWLYHLFNSAVIGAIFGWLLGPRVGDYGSGLGWGTAYGFGWWILGGLVLMPVMLGMPAFAPLRMPEMRMVAMGSLVGHLIYGVILGALFVVFARGVPVATA